MSKPLITFLYGQYAPRRQPITMFDVGCSGGLPREWDYFGHSLHAVGFDPLIYNINRLKSAEKRPNVIYEAAFVGLDEIQESERRQVEASLSARDKFFSTLGSRSSTWHAIRLLGSDVRKAYNDGEDVVYASRRLSLDNFAKEQMSIE